MYLLEHRPRYREPWNKGKLVGRKPPLRIREIWAIRIRLQIAKQTRNLALFNLAIDSKLRGCDLVRLRVRDVANGSPIAKRTMIMQRKTKQPVQFEITEQTRVAIRAWIDEATLTGSDYLFPGRVRKGSDLTTRQYGRALRCWIDEIGLDPAAYGAHPLRCTKATLICRRRKDLRAVQLLLGHTKLESTVRYLGTEVEDALEIAERIDA